MMYRRGMPASWGARSTAVTVGAELTMERSRGVQLELRHLKTRLMTSGRRRVVKPDVGRHTCLTVEFPYTHR